LDGMVVHAKQSTLTEFDGSSTLCPDKKWTPKMNSYNLAKKLVSFGWNFRHENFKTNQRKRTRHFREIHDNGVSL